MKPDCALDKEASFRATTTYLVQRAYPMLPPLLCEDLCSLNAGVDRLAFSVIFELNENAQVINKWFPFYSCVVAHKVLGSEKVSSNLAENWDTIMLSRL